MHGVTNRVRRAAHCDLRIDAKHWPYAACNAAAIDELWIEKTTANPKLFNGPIQLMHECALVDQTLSARFLRTDFKTYTHWRANGFADKAVADGFGSALLRSACGAVILGRQRAGNVNGGLVYPPGGFIDPRDIRPDGRIDIEASIARELREETGLEVGEMTRTPGFQITFMGPLVSIAIEQRSRLKAEALRSTILRYLETDPDPELDDVVIMRSTHDLEAAEMPEFARVLLSNVFSQENLS